MFQLQYSKTNIIKGAIVYSVFDAIAAIYLGQFSWLRFFGVMFFGATIYSFEIPNYFSWIEKRCSNLKGYRQQLAKTLYAILYFNPLWIARHILIIDLLTIGESSMSIFTVAVKSFIVNIPISFIANYLIQNQIKVSNRFISSAIFSGLMAIYYAFSKTLFS